MHHGKQSFAGRVLVCASLVLALSHRAFAVDRDWVGSTGGGDGVSFGDPLNWQSAAVPAPGDTLLFGTGTASVALPGGSYDRLAIDQGGPFTFSGAIQLAGGDLVSPSLLVNRPGTVFDGLTLTGVIGRVAEQVAGDLRLENGSNVSFTDTLYIGQDAVGRVDVVGGSTLSATQTIFVGLGTGTGDATLVVAGTGSSLTVVPKIISGFPFADLTIGSNRSRGVFHLLDAATASTRRFLLGGTFGQDADVLIDGASTQLDAGSDLTLHNGDMLVSGGAEVTVGRNVTISRESSTVGYLEVAGGGTRLDAVGYLSISAFSPIQPGGTGFYLHSGAIANFGTNGFLDGDGDTSNGYAVRLAGTNTQMTLGEDLSHRVGAELLIESGAAMTIGENSRLGFANSATADLGYVKLTGNQTVMRTRGTASIGYRGSADLRIEGNARYVGDNDVLLGENAGHAEVNVVYGELVAGGDLVVGNAGALPGGTANLVLHPLGTVDADRVLLNTGGHLDMSAGGWLRATRLVNNGGTYDFADGRVYFNFLSGFTAPVVFGNDAIIGFRDGFAVGTNYSGTMTVGNKLTVGTGDNSQTNLLIDGSTTHITTTDLAVASGLNASATVRVQGGTLEALLNVIVGEFGEASVEVQAGATLKAGRLIEIGDSSFDSASVSVTGVGARLEAGSLLAIGNNDFADASVTVSQAGHVQAGNIVVGYGTTTNRVIGRLTVEDGTLAGNFLSVRSSGVLSTSDGAGIDVGVVDFDGRVTLRGVGTTVDATIPTHDSASNIDTPAATPFVLTDHAEFDVDRLLIATFGPAHMTAGNQSRLVAHDLIALGVNHDAQWDIGGGAEVVGTSLYVGIGGELEDLATMTVQDAGSHVQLSGSLYLSGGVNVQTLERFDTPGRGTLVIGQGAQVQVVGETVNFAGGTIELERQTPGVALTTGSFEQQDGAALRVLLADLASTSVVVTGQAVLGGALEVAFQAGLTPAIGQAYTVLTADDIVGVFDSFSAPAAPEGALINLVYDTHAVRIEIVSAVVPGDTDGDGDIDDLDLGTAFSNYTGPQGTGKTPADGDTDGDGDIDDTDLGTLFVSYTGPLGPAVVPEPRALLAFGALALGFAVRRTRGTPGLA
ncbi:MAG: beta strand repeat-containing protein [Phycisphaeraceae bacterium]